MHEALREQKNNMNEIITPSLPGFELVKPFRFASQPYEYKVVPLRECPTPENLQL